MRKKMSIMLVTVFLLTVAISSLTIPIYSSDVQPVGEGKRGGLLDQHESLQAYSFSEPPETEWNKTYGGPLDDWGEAVIETSDGGYALTGYTQSFGAGALDFWLVKADSSGNMQWNRTYGGASGDWAYSVVETSEGGYALTGWTYSFGAGQHDFWLVKVDSSGNVQWNKTYGGPDEDGARSIVRTSDGGYAIAGHTDSFGAGGWDFWLVKVDSSGNMQWNRTYGGIYSEGADCVVETSDGGYALLGYTESFGAGLSDFWLVKADSSGNMQWNRTYGGSLLDHGMSVVETSDGGYAIAGHIESSSGADFWLIKVDADGNTQWNKAYNQTDSDFAYSVVETSDGGYALGGFISVASGDFWLVKVDSFGNVQWNKTCGGAGADYAYSLVGTSDGGYALAGKTDSFGVGQNDFWLVKVAPEEVGVDWWPMFHHDLSHTGYSTSTAPNTDNVRWSYTTGDHVSSSPAVVDGAVFVGSDDGYVYAINATTGTDIWLPQEISDYALSSPAIAYDRIFVGASDGKVCALYETDGSLNWTSLDLGGAVESSPAVADGMVFVGSGNGTVYALNQQTGEVVWKNTTTAGYPVKSSPAVVDGVVYIGSNDRGVYAFNAIDGNQIWKFETRGEVESSPAVVDGVVFVGSKDTRVYALNATNGSKMWEFRTDAGVTSSPAVAYGKVFVGSWDKWVYALPQFDPNGDGTITTDEVEWKNLTAGLVRSSPGVADGKVFVGSDDGNIYVFNATDGSVVWSYKTDDSVYSSPAIASTVVGGMVFVGSDDHKVYAFGPPNELPVPSFNFFPESPYICKPVKFNASDSYDPNGSITSYSWDFNGDGVIDKVESKPIADWIYTIAGTYLVNLTVTDDFVTPAKNWTSMTITILDIWYMFRHDISHTGYSTSKAPITNNTIWNCTTGDSVKSSPAIVYGKLYVGSEDGYIYALNATTGEQIWNFPTGEPVISSPAIDENVVFVGSENMKVYALNATDGNEIWSNQTGGQVISSSAIAGGMVFVASVDGWLWSVNKTTGVLKWKFRAEMSFESSPAVADGMVFIGSFDGKIYALPENDPNGDGIIDPDEVNWDFPTNGPIYSSPAVSDGMVFVGSYDGHVYALHMNGSEAWNCKTDGIIRSSPAIADGMVFIGSNDCYLYALNQTTGEEIWKYETGGEIESSPAIAEADGRGLVFVGSNDGKLYALSKAGGLYWSYQTGGSVESSPAIQNGTVFVGSNEGKVYAFRDQPDYTAHDIATVRIGPHKTVVEQNYTVSISVTVENQGTFNESFNVTFSVNATRIENKTVDKLTPGTSKTLVFEWNTTMFDKGNYTISAYAEPVLGEIDTTDNTFTDGTVKVTIVGDISGDCVVDMTDLGWIAYSYGATPSDPKWNSNRDITDDDLIDMTDLGIAAMHYGETCP